MQKDLAVMIIDCFINIELLSGDLNNILANYSYQL